MRSLIAALRTLVLPGGATTGARIVLNGVAGRIEIYDTAGDLVGVADAAHGWQANEPGDESGVFARIVTAAGESFLELSANDPAEVGFSSVFTEIRGAGGGRNLVLGLSSGTFGAADDNIIRLVSESQNAAEKPIIELTSSGGITTDAGTGNHPRWALWSRTGTLDAAGNLALAGTPITSTNVILLQGRWTDAGGNSSEFGDGLIVNNAGLIGNFGAPGGANRPYRVTALYTP